MRKPQKDVWIKPVNNLLIGLRNYKIDITFVVERIEVRLRLGIIKHDLLLCSVRTILA